MASTRFDGIKPSLSASTLKAVATFGFTAMTPVQAATIPLFLNHKDVCVEATTGSGKTLAFAIPCFEILLRQENVLKKHDVGAMVVAPTRELATQIYAVFEQLNAVSHGKDFILAPLIGGVSVNSSIETLDSTGTNMVVGTPGRIMDTINRCTFLNFKRLEVLILDEADTLLDMGFRETINQILAVLPKQRRTGLFSATQTREVKDLARAGMRNPVTVAVRVQRSVYGPQGEDGKRTSGLTQATPSTLTNTYSVSEYHERPARLVQFLQQKGDQCKTIVFVSTCACVDFYSLAFSALSPGSAAPTMPSSSSINLPKGMVVVGLHGKMVPKKRKALYKKFVESSCGVMFCTDVAARGVDIPDVDWIVQMAAPKDPSFFVHRVGRTARAGRSGGALLFVTRQEMPYIAFLRGRGVPLVAADEASQVESDDEEDGDNDNDDDDDNEQEEEKKEEEGSSKGGRAPKKNEAVEVATTRAAEASACPIITAMRAKSAINRDLLEQSSTAFMSFLMAYQKHECSYIFRFDRLDVASVAHCYALHRLPRIKETRDIKAERFEPTLIDTTAVPYLHMDKEKARLRRLKELQRENAIREEEREAARQGRGNVKLNFGNEEEDGEAKSKPDVASIWAAKAVPTKCDEDKKKRKKKRSFAQKFASEFEEYAAETTLYKKLRKGKISKADYDSALLSADMPTGQDGNDDDLDDDDNDGGGGDRKDGTGGGKFRASITGGKIDYRAKGGGVRTAFSYEKRLGHKSKAKG